MQKKKDYMYKTVMKSDENQVKLTARRVCRHCQKHRGGTSVSREACRNAVREGCAALVGTGRRLSANCELSDTVNPLIFVSLLFCQIYN